jgi:hypothetical protein
MRAIHASTSNLKTRRWTRFEYERLRRASSARPSASSRWAGCSPSPSRSGSGWRATRPRVSLRGVDSLLARMPAHYAPVPVPCYLVCSWSRRGTVTAGLIAIRKEETAVIEEEGQVGRLAVLIRGSPEALQPRPRARRPGDQPSGLDPRHPSRGRPCGAPSFRGSWPDSAHGAPRLRGAPRERPSDGRRLRADRPLISTAGDLKGEAPVAKRTDDQAATPVGGIRLRVARRAERHEAVEIEVRAALSALDDGVDLERAPVTPADAPGRRPA